MSDLDLIAPSRGPVFFSALRSALGRAPLWLITWLVTLALAAPLAASWIDWLQGALANAYPPKSVLASMGETFRFDHRQELSALQQTTAQSAAVLTFLVILFGAFSAGGWLQVFLEKTSGHSVRRFLWGGAQCFWRFFRVMILTVLTMAFAHWLFFGWAWDKFVLEIALGIEGADLEAFTSERAVVWLGWGQSAFHALFIALIFAWGDYTRTRLAMHNTRSTLWAGMCTWGLFLRHPVRTLRPLALILLVEGVIVFGLARLSWGMNLGLDAESAGRHVWMLFVVGQLVLIWQTISRAARYAAAVEVTRALVPPIEEPDPYGNRIGGPGGPQYPIDDSDEYGVSI